MRVAAIAHRNGNIALKTGTLSALQRRARERLFEGWLVEVREPVQGRVDKFLSRLEVGLVSNGGPAIPGADVLADVASKYLTAHLIAQFLRDASLLFDSQIRDATGRIHLAWSYERAGRAGIDTACAGSASVGSQDWHRRFHGERSNDDAEEQPRALFLIEDTGIFTGPTDSCACCEVSLEQWSGIDVAFGLTGSLLL